MEPVPPEIEVPSDLRDRVTAGWELSISARTDVDDSEFWAAVAEADERMAGLWHEVRRAVRPDSESVLGKLLLDAEQYRRTEARRAKERVSTPVQPCLSDDELPGMWSNSDLW